MSISIWDKDFVQQIQLRAKVACENPGVPIRLGAGDYYIATPEGKLYELMHYDWGWGYCPIGTNSRPHDRFPTLKLAVRYFNTENC